MLQGQTNLAEFKRHGVRLLCFFDGPGRIILTHGFKKQSDRTPPQEIERALRLRDAYLDEKRSRDG
jgi:phage-related protein